MKKKKLQLLTTDTLTLRSMKNTAKRDMSCELQISVNHRIFERNTHFVYSSNMESIFV